MQFFFKFSIYITNETSKMTTFILKIFGTIIHSNAKVYADYVARFIVFETIPLGKHMGGR